MAAIKYKVELTEAERSRLNEVSQRGKASVRHREACAVAAQS